MALSLRRWGWREPEPPALGGDRTALASCVLGITHTVLRADVSVQSNTEKAAQGWGVRWGGV